MEQKELSKEYCQSLGYANYQTFLAMHKMKDHFATHSKILVSISGGADSDVLLDMVERVIKKWNIEYMEVHYVFFDTKIETKATHNHLDYLEKRYGIKIERIDANVSVPKGVMIKYGQPFISKDISAKINCLQNHNFDFKNDGNKSYEELMEKYPKTKASIDWWCNNPIKPGKRFVIQAMPYLKEFMIENPPTFKISAMCCYGAKKSTSHKYEKGNDFDLKILGLRQAEGGIRATSIHSCFQAETKTTIASFYPIFWFSDNDKKEYVDFYKIKHSDMYEVYGFKRTGCLGCPFNSKCLEDLELIKDAEPILYKGVYNIFGKSYDYTRRYKEYKEQRKREEKQAKSEWIQDDLIECIKNKE